MDKDKSEINPVFTLSEKELVQKMDSDISYAFTSSGKEALRDGFQTDRAGNKQTAL